MKIACLGWGSLVWDSRDLKKTEEDWHKDGPSLPVEFTRISDNKRVTLILDKAAASLSVLWCILDQKDIGEAVSLLAIREKTPPKNISSVKIDDATEDEIKLRVIDWLKLKELDAAIWTGLSYRDGIRPSVEAVIEHLGTLIGDNKKCAEEYIKRAPTQIDTVYRRRIVETLGWK